MVVLYSGVILEQSFLTNWGRFYFANYVMFDVIKKTFYLLEQFMSQSAVCIPVLERI